MNTSLEYPPIALITGPSQSGRTTLAVLTGARLFQNGSPLFHNGTALIGWDCESYFTETDGLLTLADKIPADAVILVEEADLHEATRQTAETGHDMVIAAALSRLAEKRCLLILTTVQGKERDISAILVNNASVHMTPFMSMDADICPLAAIERTSRYLIPNPTMALYDGKDVLEAMAVANSFKKTRNHQTEGSDDRHIANQIFPVWQSTIDDMKKPEHPAFPLYYRYRIIQNLNDSLIHNLTKDDMLNFQWLESVNEHPHETVALELLSEIAPVWGFHYTPIEIPQDDKFPDGQAVVDGQMTNLEVISAQPRYPSGANLHRLAALTQPDQVRRIGSKLTEPVLICRTCRDNKPLPNASFDNLPVHDDSHVWMAIMPGSSYSADFPYNIAVTPMLTVTQEDFTEAIVGAVNAKSKIIADNETLGERNWVIVLTQGFPIIPAWYDGLPEEWPSNVDGIVVLATEQYLGGYHNWEAQHHPTVILLKCPATHGAAKCYHPSYIRHLETIDPNLLPLLEEGYKPEQLAQMTLPWDHAPIKKTLTMRDVSGNVLGEFIGASLTHQHIAEILQRENLSWSSDGQGHLILTNQGQANVYQMRSRVAVQHDEYGEELWTAAVQILDSEIEGTFLSCEAAMNWCESRTAVALVHITAS